MHQGVGVAAVVAGEAGVDVADAGANAAGAQQPVALVLGGFSDVSGFRRGHRGADVEHEIVAEALLARVERLAGERRRVRRRNDIIPF